MTVVGTDIKLPDLECFLGRLAPGWRSVGRQLPGRLAGPAGRRTPSAVHTPVTSGEAFRLKRWEPVVTNARFRGSSKRFGMWLDKVGRATSAAPLGDNVVKKMGLGQATMRRKKDWRNHGQWMSKWAAQVGDLFEGPSCWELVSR